MQSFTTLTSPGIALDRANIDTDQLIPARFMKQPRELGYGRFLLHDQRFDKQGGAIPDYPLNSDKSAGSQTLVVRRNFGAGSSREAAVYALYDFGFRCVIAPSFGDIFSANAVNNGVLPAIVSEEEIEQLLMVVDKPSTEITVDLEKRTIECDGVRVNFLIRDDWRIKLLNGWDDIDLTLQHKQKIEEFSKAYSKAFPWSQ